MVLTALPNLPHSTPIVWQVAPEYNVKDSILFVIDARKEMCVPTANGGKSCFRQSLDCVVACMRDRILGGERDLVGVLLFGTEKTKAPNDLQVFEHVYLLQELEEPSANSMRTISLICSEHDQHAAATAVASSSSLSSGAWPPYPPPKPEEIRRVADFGHLENSANLELANVLWVTSMLFNSSAAKNTRRRVYLLTNDDNPCSHSAAARARAHTRSRDLQQANVWMEPFFFAPPPPKTFDLSERSFWRELVGSVRQNYKPPTRATRQDGGEGAETAAAAAASAGDTTSTTDLADVTAASAATSSGADVVGGSFLEDRTDGWLSTCVATAESELLERVRRTMFC